jgi:ATP-dependent Zn protease
MDGIDNPPFWRRFWTNRTNTFLDASYVIPRRMRKASLRLPQAKPRKDQIFFIGATNVPLEQLDPALTRPGRMGRHVWFRTPTKPDRLDIFDLYLGKVSHDPELDTPEARDELARLTNGYSPAMIDQVCSMALTYAQHDLRERFERRDIVEAMTTVEAGTAIGWEYVPEELRQVAIHEAGHAVCSFVYEKGNQAVRLSVRRRGQSGGHFYATATDERFVLFRSEVMADLTTTLGAMAAEHVFYGENTEGVGGDVQSATYQAARMVGAAAMSAEAPDLPETLQGDERDEVVAGIMKRFERIGLKILNPAAAGSAMGHDAVTSALMDRDKRALAAQLLGQAFVRAYNLILANKEGVSHVADVLVERREIYGDDVVKLLQSVNLKEPKIDLTKEEFWPQNM